MIRDNLDRLLACLQSDYGSLLSDLMRFLRSKDLAQEALHETYLKLRRDPEVGEVRSPRGYLLRMALNLARNSQEKEHRYALLPETLADDGPTPARVAEARSDIHAVRAALDRLPSRRLAIFTASVRDEASTDVLAARFGLSPRTIQRELKAAVCDARRAVANDNQDLPKLALTAGDKRAPRPRVKAAAGGLRAESIGF
jgi:RNA polymerase sigma factor (sigma-70 family)